MHLPITQSTSGMDLQPPLPDESDEPQDPRPVIDPNQISHPQGEDSKE